MSQPVIEPKTRHILSEHNMYEFYLSQIKD
jgi:hypothetical protein